MRAVTVLRRSAIRRVALCIAIALGAAGFTVSGSAGCGLNTGGGGTDPEPLPITALAARYVLDAVNSLPLPVTLSSQSGRTTSVVADTLLFALSNPTVQSGSFTEIVVTETREGTNPPVAARQEVSGSARTFTRSNGAAIQISAFIGGTNVGGSAAPASGQQPATLFLYDNSGRSWRFIAR